MRSLLAFSLALGCGAPQTSQPQAAPDPSIEIRAAYRDVGRAINDGMTSSGYHARRNEPYVLEYESNGSIVGFSLAERPNTTYVLARITLPDGGDISERNFRRFELSSQVQRFLNAVRTALETGTAPAQAAPPPPPPAASPAPSPVPSPAPPSERPGKPLKRLGL